MGDPNHPPVPEGGVLKQRKRKRQPLYIRLYTHRVYEELVKFIGYKGKPLPEAQEFVLQLSKEYGKEKVEEAGTEIVVIEGEILTRGERVKMHPRQASSRAITPKPSRPAAGDGAQDSVAAADPATPATPPAGASAAPSRHGAKGALRTSVAEGVPIRQPRTVVLPKFEEWLLETNQGFITGAELAKRYPELRHLKALDYFVQGEGRSLLVTLRPSCTKRQVEQMQEWEGTMREIEHCQAVRIWPCEGQNGWEWREFPLSTTSLSSADLPQPVAPPPSKTSILEQYREAKKRHPGMLLLFRMGDFYELFEEDAETAAKLLGLTLTSRDKTLSMAGFPHHQLEAYLRKLLTAGHRVAVCEEVKESLPQGPIRREVMRVVTPGSIHGGQDADHA